MNGGAAGRKRQRDRRLDKLRAWKAGDVAITLSHCLSASVVSFSSGLILRLGNDRPGSGLHSFL